MAQKTKMMTNEKKEEENSLPSSQQEHVSRKELVGMYRLNEKTTFNYLKISIRQLMDATDKKFWPEDTVSEIQAFLEGRDFSKALWLMTPLVDHYEFARDKDLVKLLLQLWELAHRYQQFQLDYVEKTAVVSEDPRDRRSQILLHYKKREVASCQAGIRAVQRHMDEAHAHHGLKVCVHNLCCVLNRKYSNLREIKDYMEHGYYSDAFWKLTNNHDVQNDERLLRLLEKAWVSLCCYQHFRLERTEDMYTDYFHSKFAPNALIILDLKRKEVVACEEGKSKTSNYIRALEEEKKWWWQNLKNRKSRSASTNVKKGDEVRH